MKKFTMFACVALMLGMALSSVAGERPVYTSNVNSVINGGNSNFAKASGDTIDLMGPGAAYQGDFEAKAGGWTHWDITQPTETHWSLSTINNDLAGINGTSMWCGAMIDACAASDSAWGYNNSWHDLVEWRHTVDDVNSSCIVTVDGNLYYDSEPGYDYTYLSYKLGGQLGYVDQAVYNPRAEDVNGDPAAEHITETITYLPGEYVDGQVVIYFRFQSDGGWSDGDCSWPTRGAVNVDDITMSWVNGTFSGSTYDDFEGKGWGNWGVSYPDGVGDFAQIWSGLDEIDPCHVNFSNQYAFIDDGVVVSGVGPSTCIEWCYGPSGYIVNTKGGAAGPSAHIHNAIESPVMAWPNMTDDGIIFGFDVFRHENLSATAPGMFYTWSVRSASASQDITTQPWLDRNYVYYGDPTYLRVLNDVTDLMEPQRTEVQLQATVYELGYAWGWTGDNGYPAPYFDNFSVKIFPYQGPGMTTRDINIAQDNFPEIPVIDYANPQNNSVRFDMAMNIALATTLRNDPGDSITCTIVPVRNGSVLVPGSVKMVWALQTAGTGPTDDVFYNGRTAPGYGPSALTGEVLGVPAVGASGIPSETVWAFDLPDTGFLFPGDILQYYFEATDDVGGVQQTATLPADITGFGDFSHPLAYDSNFWVHCLPTITNKPGGGFQQPGMLFLNDFANRGGEQEWYGAFDNLGLIAGRDYDLYYTQGPSSGVGNGIGGRATSDHIAGYNQIVYTSGDLGVNTIANGDFDNDAGDDVGVLTQWLLQNDKCMFLTGDNLAGDLNQAGTVTTDFLNTYMGLDFYASDIRPLIDNQATPTVKAVPGNSVIVNQDCWVAYGGCNGINTFDAVKTRTGAERLAEFTDPAGNLGMYDYSAATLMYNADHNDNVISMPYDFMFIYDATGCPEGTSGLTARAVILKDVLGYCGVDANPGDVTAVPDAAKFVAKAFPNPFNPQTTIKFTLPKEGPVSVKIFNVRGELVKTLIDEVQTAGEHSVLWDGTSNAGSSVSSGVYFYEARSGSEVQVDKITMVK